MDERDFLYVSLLIALSIMCYVLHVLSNVTLIVQ